MTVTTGWLPRPELMTALLLLAVGTLAANRSYLDWKWRQPRGRPHGPVSYLAQLRRRNRPAARRWLFWQLLGLALGLYLVLSLALH